MRLKETDFPEVKIIFPEIITDSRGSFAEIYDKLAFSKFGIDLEFVQDVWSISMKSGTIRGLHFQIQPYAQAKLVRVTQGRVFDVIVDLRPSKPSFGKHISIELDAVDKCAVFIPTGFAHGFCGLDSENLVFYGCTNYRSKKNEIGILWNDDYLKIKWPKVKPIISIKDKKNEILKLVLKELNK